MSETEDYSKTATPTAHKTTHQDGGSDEINVDGLSGELADDQKSAWDKISGKPSTFPTALDYVYVADIKTYDAHGGTFTSGAWQTRDINNEVSDPSGICSIANNQITLEAGIYIAHISAPAYGVSSHITRLMNVTDSVVTLRGSTERAWTDYSHVTRSFIVGIFTIAASKALEVQHYCVSTQSDDGFGRAHEIEGTANIYTQAEFLRIGATS